jgi:DNA mismatch repair ATPase MutS
MKDPEANLKLPDSINSISEINQLINELEDIEEFFLKMKAKSSLSQVDIPKTSVNLDELAKINNLNLMKSESRTNLKLFLHFLRTKAPSIHLSFGSLPESLFLSKLANWFRSEVNPYVLISVGLQPNIGAGFKIRTTNKYYDFSLRKYLIANKQTLVDALGPVNQK